MSQIGSFSSLQTSLRALLAFQRSLDVTAHNISNADTEGYTRQEASLVAATPLTIDSGALANGSGAQLGQGVDVSAYRRMRDSFLDLQYRAQNMTLGERSALADGLSGVEDQLNEPGDSGIASLLNDFWDSWEDLANNPVDGGAKAATVGKAQTLADALNDLDSRLSDLSANAGAQYASITTDTGNTVGGYADDLVRLNAAIKSELAVGRQPNDLLDQRDLVLDKLSELGQVSTTDSDGDGAVDVSFGDAALPLVDGTGTINWPQTLTAPGGKLGGLLDLQTRIQSYRDDLDAVASSLITSVNSAYGGTVFNGTSASTISVAVTTSTIQAGTSGLAADSGLATAVAALRNGAVDTGYAALVRRIGAEASDASRAQSTQDTVVTTLSERRSSVSGVSLDEEMTNMVRFQRGYQAAARVMSTLDDMLETLISRTGRVGL